MTTVIPCLIAPILSGRKTLYFTDRIYRILSRPRVHGRKIKILTYSTNRNLLDRCHAVHGEYTTTVRKDILVSSPRLFVKLGDRFHIVLFDDL